MLLLHPAFLLSLSNSLVFPSSAGFSSFAGVPALALQEPPAEGTAPAEPATPEEPGVDVTFLANAGFYLESRQHAVLIDAFLREPTSNYSALPANLQGQLVNAKPPFDRATTVLVSHNHPDHLEPRALEKYLASNPASKLTTSAQIMRALRKEARDFPAIQERVQPITTLPGKVETLSLDGLKIECFELTHGSKTGNEELVNLAHLIEIGGLKILHVGDAEPSAASFEPFHLGERGIDVLIVPYWFFASDAAVSVVRSLNARETIVCHLPKSDRDRILPNLKRRHPQVILFEEALQKRRFVPAGAGSGTGG